MAPVPDNDDDSEFERELKGFQRVTLEPGATTRVEFRLHTDDLAFYGRDNTLIVEPGDFHAGTSLCSYQ